MTPRVVFAVGSQNPAKVEPVRRLLRRWFPGCRVRAVAVSSGVRPQPLSLEETRAGAAGRARRALEAVAQARWGIGVEGGVELDAEGNLWLVTVAAVADRQGRITWGEGARVPLPAAYAAPLLAGAQLAELVEASFGRHGARTDPGAVGFLTLEALTRRQLVWAAVAAAAAPRLNGELYGFQDMDAVPGSWKGVEG